MDLSSLARFHIAPGYDPAAPDTWVWEDRSADVDHVDGGVTITGGRQDEVSEAAAGSASLRVDNAGGHYCTRNPLGRWYGRLARGCPARWGTISGAEAFSTNATNSWGTPDVGTSWTLEGSASDWSISGGVGLHAVAAAGTARSAWLNGADARNGDATYVCSSAVVATGGPLRFGLQVRYTSGNDHLFFRCELGISGAIVANISRQLAAGLSTLNEVTTGVVYSAGERIKVRCQWDGEDLRLKVWEEASAEPAAWSVTATDNLCQGSGVALRSWRGSGNTNAGTVTFSYDDLEIEAVEIVGTIPAFPVRWDPTAQVSYAPIQIAGVIRRLGQGQQPLRSPIYRQLVAQPGCGYWPLEDGSNAHDASTPIVRGIPARVADGTFGSTDCPAGASASLTLNTASISRVYAQVQRWTVPQDGYAVMFYFKLGSLPGGTGLNLFSVDARGTVARWMFQVANATITINGYDSDGTQILGPSAQAHTLNLTDWIAIQLEAQESGGTVNWALIWHQVGSTAFTAPNGSYAGTADLAYAATVYAPVAATGVSHLWIGDDLLPFVDTVFMKVSSGYDGELAADRIARLCAEEGVAIAVEAGDSEPMGIQRTAGLLDLLRTAESADLGLLYEAGTSLGYRPRKARYNRATDMTLAIAPAGDIADTPEPTDDDQAVRNEWTVSRDGGGEATDSDPVHIAASGRYPDSTTINVQFDSRLQEHASWRVHLGTWGEMRWPQLVVEFADRPDLLAFWRGRRYAPRITVTGVPSQGPIGVDPDLIVEGWTQEITSANWRVTLNCSPARPWDVGTYDDGVARYDSASTSVHTGSGGVASGATTITFATEDPAELWSTTSEPYDVMIAGQRNTVTSMAAATSDATLTANSFEAGASGWDPTGCTITQSAVFAHTGSFSGLLTVTGSPASAFIRKTFTQSPPVIPGQEYSLSAWVRSAVNLTDVQCFIDFRDASAALISSLNSGSAALLSGSWVQRTMTATCPAGAAFAQYGVIIQASPATGTLLYTDDLLLSATTVRYQDATVTRGVNGITKALAAGDEIRIATPGRWAM